MPFTMKSTMTSIESLQFPGYFCVPGDDKIVVSKSGSVINTRTGNMLKVSNNDNGYKTFSLHYRNESNELANRTYLLHRVLASAFIEIPFALRGLESRQIQVNHKDANKHNNDIDNLEWINHQGNSIHAAQNELIRNSKPVVARHINTREIVRFVSVNDCAYQLELDEQLLRYHLTKGVPGTKVHLGYVFKFEDDKTPWPENVRLVPLTASKTVIGKNVVTGQLVIHKSCEALCNDLKLNYNGYKNHCKLKGADIPYHQWIIRDLDLTDPDDQNSFDEWVKPNTTHHRSVSYQVTNMDTQEVSQVQSFSELVKLVNYSNAAVVHAFKNKEGIIGKFKMEKLGNSRTLQSKTS